MKGKSHRLLAAYMAEVYLSGQPKSCVRAFQMGCIQPDRNPTTYLKGSMRQQWLRGHNWGNAQRYIQRLCRRLERKQRLRLWDCYYLGKLVHYTADAFTYPHNSEFPDDLKQHNAYEEALQAYFLAHFRELTRSIAFPAGTAMDTIQVYHRDYLARPFHIHTDSRFAVSVCCCILGMLVP